MPRYITVNVSQGGKWLKSLEVDVQDARDLRVGERVDFPGLPEVLIEKVHKTFTSRDDVGDTRGVPLHLSFLELDVVSL